MNSLIDTELKRQASEILITITYHDNLYYNNDNPEISDEEYDDLVKQFLAVGGSFDDIAKGDVSSEFDRVTHLYPIKSLDKIHTEDEVRSALIKLAPGEIQPKIDGLTMVVYGDDTVSPEAIFATKGTGTVGENVNKTGSVIPKLTPIRGLTYRTEVFMPISEFNKLNEERVSQGLEPHKNPRNAAAGMIRTLDNTRVKGLTYMAYNILGTDKIESDQIKMLKTCGLITVPSLSYTMANIEEAVTFMMTYNDTRRAKLDYEIDGLVIKTNIPNSLEVFGSTGHHPKNAIAFKFPSQGADTTLERVVWQVGRTGQITPVAEFTPIEIMGSTVSRATLHNYDNIAKLGLSESCWVHVIKANDVIPKITRCFSATGLMIPLLRYCPECGNSVTHKGANVYCINAECKAFIIARTTHLTKREALDIDGLSVKTIEKMFETGVLKKPYDLFTLTVDDLLSLPGFAKKSAEKTYKTIQDARTVELNRFIYAAGIPLVGRTVSKDIANKLLTYNAIIQDIASNQCTQIRSIPGIGTEILTALISNMKTLVDFSYYVKPIDKEVPTVAPVSKSFARHYNFVITGKLTNVRSMYEDLCNQLGHILQKGVNSSTDYLVNNDINSPSSKNMRAKELNIPIITEATFLKILNESK